MLLWLFACDPAPSPAEPVTVSTRPSAAACATAPHVTWENWGQGFFMTRCGACHSPSAQDRHGAPAGVDFVTHADMVTWSDRIQHTVLDAGTMPLGGGLGDDDRALLQTLLLCGT